MPLDDMAPHVQRISIPPLARMDCIGNAGSIWVTEAAIDTALDNIHYCNNPGVDVIFFCSVVFFNLMTGYWQSNTIPPPLCQIRCQQGWTSSCRQGGWTIDCIHQ